MQRITRHRKAFYEKENDFKNVNTSIDYDKQFLKYLPPINNESVQSNKYMVQSIQSYQTVQSFQPIQSFQSISSARNFQTNFIVNIPKNQTEYFCQNYANNLLNDSINYQISPKFLKNHKIDFNLRARMLDWMVQVTSSYKFNHKTYYAGIQLMDRYFQKENQSLHPNNLHLIGVLSMMIASKMQEVYPLKLKTVHQKICHKKMNQRQITNFQSKITQTLNYRLNSWTFYDLAIAKLHILIQLLNKRKPAFRNVTNNYQTYNYNQKSLVDIIKQNQSKIEDICSYIGKFLYYDYQFFCSYTLSIFSDVLLKLTFEILKIPCQIDQIMTSPQIQVQLCKQKLIQKIKQFDFKFKGINNLKKFTAIQIIQLVQKQIQ